VGGKACGGGVGGGEGREDEEEGDKGLERVERGIYRNMGEVGVGYRVGKEREEEDGRIRVKRVNRMGGGERSVLRGGKGRRVVGYKMVRNRNIVESMK
jgi:hypothetical protein